MAGNELNRSLLLEFVPSTAVIDDGALASPLQNVLHSPRRDVEWCQRILNPMTFARGIIRDTGNSERVQPRRLLLSKLISLLAFRFASGRQGCHAFTKNVDVLY
jgi:hypothetical protein